MASALTFLTVPTCSMERGVSHSCSVGRGYSGSTYVNGLGVVSQPIPKVDPFHIELAKFLAAISSGHHQGQQRVLDVAMAPVGALNFRRRGNVASAEGVGGASPEYQEE